MKWVVETCFEENVEEFKKYCDDICIIKYCPFSSAPYEVVEGEPPDAVDNKVMFYGSINLGRFLIHHGCRWQIWLPDNVFDCNYYLPRFDYALNSDSFLSPMGYEGPNEEYPYFIRPNSGYKSFTGQVIRTPDEIKFLIKKYNIFPEEIVLVSSCKKIPNEYRFVIATDIDDQHQSITGSSYILDHFHNESNEIPNDLWCFVDHVLSDLEYNPCPLWTLDICEVVDGNQDYYAITEVGSFTSAGMYKCNIERIVNSAEIILKDYLV